MRSRSGVGKLFALAGPVLIAIGVLGAIAGWSALGTSEGLIAGGVFIMIGVIWTIVGVATSGAFARIGQSIGDWKPRNRGGG